MRPPLRITTAIAHPERYYHQPAGVAVRTGVCSVLHGDNFRADVILPIHFPVLGVFGDAMNTRRAYLDVDKDVIICLDDRGAEVLRLELAMVRVEYFGPDDGGFRLWVRS